jgi:hypothetical protein
MSLKIIFPNEEKMKVTNLDNIKENLLRLLLKKFSPQEVDNLNRYLGEIQGYLLVADRKNLKEYFDYFCKINFLDLFNNFFEKRIEAITYSMLEMVTFLTINIQNQELLEYIYSKKYPTQIAGQQMNLIDKLISLDTKKNEEYLTYQINFIKSLTLKMNINSLNYFYDSNINQFPILTKSLSLYNHRDPLIRNVVKNIFLAIIKIENNNLREFLISFPINLYYSNIVFQLKNTIMNLCLIDLGDDGGVKTFGKMQKEHDFIVDTIFYIGDLLSLKIQKINFILINCLLNEIIFPLIYVLVNQKNDKITIYHSLYIICLFLFTCKNEFLNKIITYLLFQERIPNNLYYKLSSSPFDIINRNMMEIINFLITNNLYADINDPGWQKIKTYMKKTTGIDLSLLEIDLDNIYDYCDNLIKTSNENDKIKNTIFENVKTYFICNDDAIILILNLIVNSCIKYYKDLPQANSIIEQKAVNINEIDDDDDNDDFNLFGDSHNKNKIIEPQIQSNNIYNLLDNIFFEVKAGNNISDNIFNYLFNYLDSLKIFRLATYEIILINIQLFIKTVLEKNNELEYKLSFAKKLLDALDNQYKKMNNLLKTDKTISKYLFDCCIRAYDHYIKNAEKKISDLITLPNILVPMIYLDKIEEIPEFLREDKTNKDFLRNYIFNIFFINDILNELAGRKELIKQNKFPLSIETIKFSIGKIYNEKELGEDYVHCQIFRNNAYIVSQAILSADTLYFGEVMSKTFKDLSQIKIFKKIPLRYLEIKPGENNYTLNLIDRSTKMTQKNPIKMHCLNSDNTKIMYNYLIQQTLFCQNLEESLFTSFMEEMKRRLNDTINYLK